MKIILTGINKEVVRKSPYPPFEKNNTLYFQSKSSIFFKGDVLLTTGRSPHPRSSEKSSSKICTFQPVITKNTKKSNELFSPDLLPSPSPDLAAPNNPENARPDHRG